MPWANRRSRRCLRAGSRAEFPLSTLAVNQRIRGLQRSDRSDGLGALQLLGIEIRDADPAHFALPLQFGERGPALFEFGRSGFGGQ